MISANEIQPGTTVRPLSMAPPEIEIVRFSLTVDPPLPQAAPPPPSFFVEDVRNADLRRPMSVALKVDGAWQVWPAEALFEKALP